jgi:hypothetical protein
MAKRTVRVIKPHGRKIAESAFYTFVPPVIDDVLVNHNPSVIKTVTDTAVVNGISSAMHLLLSLHI